MLPLNKSYKNRKVSLTIHCKYKYFDSTVQWAEDRRQKFYFCRLTLAVNVKLNLSNVKLNLSNVKLNLLNNTWKHAYVQTFQFPDFQKLLSRCFIAEIRLKKFFSAYAGFISATLSSSVYRCDTKIAIELVNNVTQLKARIHGATERNIVNSTWLHGRNISCNITRFFGFSLKL